MEHLWGDSRPFNSYSAWVRKKHGVRLQKLSIDAGFSCPNRDGSKGRGGCTYCNNNTFTPEHVIAPKSIKQQINESLDFFRQRKKSYDYVAYFQAYSNTYDSLDNLKTKYEQALAIPEIKGLVIGTRPDCIDEEKVAYLSELSKSYHVSIEFGLESLTDSTLKNINRCHTVEDSISALEMCRNKGIHVGGHLIMGLPGEGEEHFSKHAKLISSLPIDSMKFHQLQIVRGTTMHKQYRDDPSTFDLFTPEKYINSLIQFLEHLNPKIALERFTSESPKDLLVAPKWGMKNFEFTAILEKEMIKLNSWQGKHYQTST